MKKLFQVGSLKRMFSNIPLILMCMGMLASMTGCASNPILSKNDNDFIKLDGDPSKPKSIFVFLAHRMINRRGLMSGAYSISLNYTKIHKPSVVT